MVIYPVQLGGFLERQPITVENLNEDVLGYVFGFVEDDPGTLLACSLVCHSWCSASRQYIFKRIQIRPDKLFSAELLDQHPLVPRNIRHIRCIERYNCPPTLFKSCPMWKITSGVLTTLTLRKTVTEFKDIICAVTDIPHLESLALIDIAFPVPLAVPVSRKTDFHGCFLPRSMRRLRLRNVTSLLPFFIWLAAHPEDKMPPLTHLDCGPMQENDLFLSERVLARVTGSLRHVIGSFAPGALGHACTDNKDIFKDIAVDMNASEAAELPERGPQRNHARFRQVFGMPHCFVFGTMDNLSVVHIEEFADDSYCLQPGFVTAAEFVAPRICASLSGTHLKRLVFGMDISSVARLSQYNINWSFLDEIFVSDAYARVEAIEFRNAGRAKIDNIADYVSSRLPRTAAMNLLLFGEADPNLVADHYS